MRLNRGGFTLIELIIVIVIIGILAAIAAPMMGNMRAKAIVTEAETGISAIAAAMQQYYVEHNSYPPVKGGGGYIGIDGLPGLSYEADYGKTATLDGTYISEAMFVAFEGAAGHPVLCCQPTYASDPAQQPPKYNDLISTMDDPNSGTGYIMYNMETKKFKQNGWSKTGLLAGDLSSELASSR